MNAILRKAV